MEAIIQGKVEVITNELKELAALIQSEKLKAENLHDLIKATSDKYDEDDFTNMLNGYQYAIDDLRAAYRSLSEALMQYRYAEEDRNTVKQKYHR